MSSGADGQTDTSGVPLSVNLITRAGTSSTEGPTSFAFSSAMRISGAPARAGVACTNTPVISRDLLHRSIAPITCVLSSVIKRLAMFQLSGYNSLVEDYQDLPGVLDVLIS